jgi:hypothetical protein
MTHHDQRNPDDEHDEHGGPDKPGTAFDEVLREAEQAATRVTDSDRRRRRRGEAGDAITPNERAQEDSHHD